MDDSLATRLANARATLLSIEPVSQVDVESAATLAASADARATTLHMLKASGFGLVGGLTVAGVGAFYLQRMGSPNTLYEGMFGFLVTAVVVLCCLGALLSVGLVIVASGDYLRDYSVLSDEAVRDFIPDDLVPLTWAERIALLEAAGDVDELRPVVGAWLESGHPLRANQRLATEHFLATKREADALAPFRHERAA